MKAIFVKNGHVKLVLVPDTDSEKELLKELGSGDVDMKPVEGTNNILGQTLVDAVVIQTKQ